MVHKILRYSLWIFLFYFLISVIIIPIRHKEVSELPAVQIRLIVDGINGFLQLRGSGMFQALTSNPNVEAKLYNPVNLLLPFRINYRMHDKYLIADESVYILGGRNTNDLFLGNYRDSYNLDIRSTYLDTEMMLRVESRELNRAIRADAEQYQEKSKLCTPDGQEKENSGYQKVRLSLLKKGIYQVLRMMILPIRHLL